MVVQPVTPEYPPMARQQGISGTVQVVVSLNEQDGVVSTRILSSPSAVLNAAALAAARSSVFRTERRDCVPVAASYVFSVSFGAEPRPMIEGTPTAPIVRVTASAILERPPDIAQLSMFSMTVDETSAGAVVRDERAEKAFAAAPGIAGRTITVAEYSPSHNEKPLPGASPPPGSYSRAADGTPRYGYIIVRRDVVSIPPEAAAAAADAAASRDGATSIVLRYGLRDRDRAYAEALASAMRNALAQARAIASSAGLTVAGPSHVETYQPSDEMFGAYIRVPPGTSTAGTNVLPAKPTVLVRATVTVTYALKR
ncbi:MAG TPA: SIMPL domain-containing protein [Candidatus Elarobacter sp.]